VTPVSSRRAWLIGTAALALALYALLWVGFTQHWHWLEPVDGFALDAFHSYGVAHPGWVVFWDMFCTVLGPTAFRLLALAVILAALVRRNLRAALFLLISVELSGVLSEAAKAAAGRPRPAEALVNASSTSFPSGHAVGVMVGVLALLTVVLPVVRRPLRIWLIAAGVVVVVTIGVARVVLDVHRVSDVLAGWALGYVWFVVCTLLIRPAAPITAADETPEVPGSSR
jgi:membrane-associated phospholipid phosphatase